MTHIYQIVHIKPPCSAIALFRHLSIFSLWHLRFYPRTEAVGTKCLQHGGDSFLHVGVCYKTPASQVL